MITSTFIPDLKDVDSVKVTMQFTMPMHEWVQLKNIINEDKYPGRPFANEIQSMVNQMQKVYYPEDPISTRN